MSRHSKHRVVSAGSAIGDYVLLYCLDCGHFLEGYFDEWKDEGNWRKKRG